MCVSEEHLGISYPLCGGGQVPVTVSVADAGCGGGAAAADAAHHAGVTAAVSAHAAGHAPLHAALLPRAVLTDVAPHLQRPETQHQSHLWNTVQTSQH